MKRRDDVSCIRSGGNLGQCARPVGLAMARAGKGKKEEHAEMEARVSANNSANVLSFYACKWQATSAVTVHAELHENYTPPEECTIGLNRNGWRAGKRKKSVQLADLLAGRNESKTQLKCAP